MSQGILLFLLAVVAGTCSSLQPSLSSKSNSNKSILLTQDCYDAIREQHTSAPVQLESPKAMADGTYLIEWRLSPESYGSCKVDGQGRLLMLISG